MTSLQVSGTFFFQFIISHSLAVSSCVLSWQEIEPRTLEMLYIAFIHTRLKPLLMFYFSCSQSAVVKHVCCSLLQSFACSQTERLILEIIDQQFKSFSV